MVQDNIDFVPGEPLQTILSEYLFRSKFDECLCEKWKAILRRLTDLEVKQIGPEK